jgi:hypothetical protein
MSMGEVISDENPEIRLLWSASLPGDLSAQEVKELQEHGFILNNWNNPEANTIGSKSLRFNNIDSSTYFAVRRTPIVTSKAEDYEEKGTHFGLITSIEDEVAETWQPATVALSGLIEEFKRRRGI